jgi:20S proteasome subunit alpha 2
MLVWFQGAYFAWKATAMGKNQVNGKTFLEKRSVWG